MKCQKCGKETTGTLATGEAESLVMCRKCYTQYSMTCPQCRERILKANMIGKICNWCKADNEAQK
jgi:hypothetical protein